MRVDHSVSGIVLGAVVLALLVATPFVSTGFFSLDEVIYFAGADALFRDGSLFVDNGFDEFGSEDLRIWFLVQGQHGLTPQYPVGTALLGAPFLSVFGVRGLIIINVLAGIGTLFATRSLAKQMFGHPEIGLIAALILVLGTFWPEYVYGHWPHSISLFFVTVSLLAFNWSLDRSERAISVAAISGLALGAAMLFRLDSILALPAYFLAIVLYAQRPVALILGGALGLVPAVAMIAAANLQKFGVLNPLSYGRVTGGSTDASSHIAVASVLCLAVFFALAIRFISIRRVDIRWVGFAVLVCAATALTVPLIYEVARNLVIGFVRLIVDSRGITRPEFGVAHLRDGTVSFWGLPKKALAQSLPWLAILFLLVFRSRQEHKRHFVVAMIFVVVWILPFLDSSWHGGLGSNMRYFIPTLPVLASVAAFLIFNLFQQTKKAPTILASGWICGVACVFGWANLHPSQWFGAHQIFPTLIFYLSAPLFLVAGLLKDSAGRLGFPRVLLFVVGAAIGVSSILANADFLNSQNRRTAMEAHSRNAGSIQESALFYGPPERFASAISNPEQIVALPDRLTGKIDTGLIALALNAGYLVLMPSYLAKSPDIVNGNFTIVESARWAELKLVQVAQR